MHIKNSLGKNKFSFSERWSFYGKYTICKGRTFFNRINKVTRQYEYLTEDIDTEVIIFIPDINNEDNAEEKYEILEQRLKKMFPLIENIEAQYKYCGAFASTNDNLGFLGKDPEKPQLWYCLGYGANGILFAILGGVMLSELYCGHYNEDLELFRVDRFD